MDYKNIIFMNEKFTPKNKEINDSNFNTTESHYSNLITRLKEISKTIFLLEKTIFK